MLDCSVIDLDRMARIIPVDGIQGSGCICIREPKKEFRRENNPGLRPTNRNSTESESERNRWP